MSMPFGNIDLQHKHIASQLSRTQNNNNIKIEAIDDWIEANNDEKVARPINEVYTCSFVHHLYRMV